MSIAHASDAAIAAPARTSRISGFLLIVAGLAAIGAVWLPWLVPEIDASANAELAERATVSLKDMSDQLGGESLSPFDATVRFYLALTAGAIALIAGLIGLWGKRSSNVIAGVFGIAAAALTAHAPVMQVLAVGAVGGMRAALASLGSGGYTAMGAALLALVAAMMAFIAAGRIRRAALTSG